MKEVEEYIFAQEQDQREGLLFLHQLFTEEYDLEAKIRFNIPFYYGKSWVCYLNVLKSQKIELAFTRANELITTSSLLNFKKRKQIAGIEIDLEKDLPISKIKEVLGEALHLDQTKSYNVKKK